MGRLPSVPVEGTVVSSYVKAFKAFESGDGVTVPAGQNSWLWLAVRDDEEPLKVKNPPKLYQQGEVVRLMLRESFGNIVCDGEA